jgi:hypothetical protein
VDAPFITAEDINYLIELISEHMRNLADGSAADMDETKRFLANTKSAIKGKAEDPKYKALNI